VEDPIDLLNGFADDRGIGRVADNELDTGGQVAPTSGRQIIYHADRMTPHEQSFA
jgi:hypothetical protein